MASKWLAALLITVVPFAGQQIPPAEPDDSGLVLRFDVNLAQIDAVVTGRDGRRVTDLTPADFEIRQDGKLQRITHFSYIPEEGPPTAAQLPSRPAPPSQLKRNQVRRTIAILVDDAGMEFPDLVRTRGALLRFVKEELRPGDLVSVLRTAVGSGALQQFSADRDYLARVVERIQWIPPIESDDLPLGYVLPQVLRAMAEFPGRKILILVGRSAGSESTHLRMMDAASRSSTVIHAVYAPGVETFAITAAERGPASAIVAEAREPLRGPLGSNIMGPPRVRAMNRQAVLKSLAEATGGLYFGGNDIDSHVVNASRDSSGYYLIGGYPGPDAFQRRAGGPPAYHRLQVRVKRDGLKVRTRAGFQAVPSAPGRRPDSRSDAAEMLDALFSPFKSGDIDVQLSSTFQYDQATGPYLISMLHVRPEGIDFKRDERGCQVADLEVLSTPLWLDQKRVTPSGITTSQQAHMEVCGESAKRVITDGFAVELRTPVEKAGAYQMRIAVRNIQPGETHSNAPRARVARHPGSTGKPPLIGSAAQMVEVPDRSRKALAITGLTIGAAPASLPPAGGVRFRTLYPEADPALRRFAAGDAVPYAVRGIAGKENVPLTARLVLLREGEKAASTEAVPLRTGESFEGTFRLDKSLAPGRYLLGVEVAEQSGKKKPDTAQSWIVLEIQ